jgi:hypothetical protein
VGVRDGGVLNQTNTTHRPALGLDPRATLNTRCGVRRQRSGVKPEHGPVMGRRWTTRTSRVVTVVERPRSPHTVIARLDRAIHLSTSTAPLPSCAKPPAKLRFRQSSIALLAFSPQIAPPEQPARWDGSKPSRGKVGHRVYCTISPHPLRSPSPRWGGQAELGDDRSLAALGRGVAIPHRKPDHQNLSPPPPPAVSSPSSAGWRWGCNDQPSGDSRVGSSSLTEPGSGDGKLRCKPPLTQPPARNPGARRRSSSQTNYYSEAVTASGLHHRPATAKPKGRAGSRHELCGTIFETQSAAGHRTHWLPL